MPQCPEKPKPNRDDGGESPASRIDPLKLSDVGGKRGSAGLADTARRAGAAGGGQSGEANAQKTREVYKTAFDLATKRAQENNDPKAMTMLGELYANALGVKRDYAKAAEWYKRGAEAGDREAMFALAMLRLSGHGSTMANREEGARWLASSAKLGNPKAAYNLALLYLDGQTFPQDVKRAAELLRVAADAGNPEAQYALATFYKEGTGVEKSIDKAVRLLQAASLADNVDAEVEYAIALFNGTGTPKDEPRAIALFRKAAMRGSPIAQNRLARILAAGRGVPADPVEATKWHLIAKAGGASDPSLDDFVQKQAPETRAAADKAAKPWLDFIAQARS